MLRGLVVAILVVFLSVLSVIWFLQAPTAWTTMGAVRTPAERFEGLPDYPFEPNYLDIQGYRVHYVDEGPRNGPVILLLHGEPSWSYLYRKMIPQFAEEQFRVIAPDLVGFGKSDKPTRMEAYSYQMQVDIMSAFVEQLDLQDITLFGQDWGGLIGLRLAPLHDERFSRIVIGNTGLPSAEGLQGIVGYPLFRYRVWREGRVSLAELEQDFSFTKWVAHARTAPRFDIARLIQNGTVTELPPDVLAAYNAPFPDETYKAGARAMPYFVPSQLRQNDRVWRHFYMHWDKPFLTAFSDSDPVTKGGEALFVARVPGAKGQRHEIVVRAGHFLQEDQPDQLVDIILDFAEQDS